MNLSMASIARLLLETVRSDQTEHNNNHAIKSQAVDIVEAPGEEGRVRGGVVPQLDEEQLKMDRFKLEHVKLERELEETGKIREQNQTDMAT